MLQLCLLAMAARSFDWLSRRMLCLEAMLKRNVVVPRLLQLTWRSNKVLSYSVDNLDDIKELHSPLKVFSSTLLLSVNLMSIYAQSSCLSSRICFLIDVLKHVAD